MGFEVSYNPCENIKIVKAVEKHPVLYDTGNYPPVEFRGLTDQTWAIVAAELNVSEAYLKQRWTNIRGCFKRYLRNKLIKKSTKTYYLAKYLKFMLPFTKIDVRVPKKKKKVNRRPPVSNDVFEDESDQSVSEIFEESSESQEYQPQTSSNDFELKLVDSDGEEESYIISTNASTSDEVTVPEPGENPDWDFFSSILPDVRKMTPQQKVKFRNAMLSAVDNALYGDDLV